MRCGAERNAVSRRNSRNLSRQAGALHRAVRCWQRDRLARPPTPIVSHLQALLVKATRSASAQNFYVTTGIDPYGTTPSELAKFQLSESEEWGRDIKAAGI